jgi:hypothetical protein
MFPRYALFGMDAFIVLWILTAVGAIAVLPSWAFVEQDCEEGVITRAGRYLVWARVFLTFGCIVIWFCTYLGHALTGPSDITFGFWQKHPALLQELFLLADSIFVASVALVRKARGNRKWILWLTAPIMTAASAVGSLVLFFN